MTPLFKKLNFKDPQEILVVNAPTFFETELADIGEYAKIQKDIKKVKTIDFAIIFVLTQEQIDNAIDLIFPKLNGDAVLWFCYPKGTSKKYKCDFNRDTGWETLGNYNLEGVRQVAIDEDWSALRFRKTEYIKTLTRRESYAISKDGKERTKKNTRR
ncbi:MAG TPA: hypothetical protein PK239_15765 [Chitinophagales bacterium]|nr:hypothetical protein [Chitinophagales bacterium]